jgi:hypothetical protein
MKKLAKILIMIVIGIPTTIIGFLFAVVKLYISYIIEMTQELHFLFKDNIDNNINDKMKW